MKVASVNEVKDSRKLQTILDKSQTEIAGGRGIAHERFWQEVEKEQRPRKRKGSRPRRNKRQ